MSKINNKISRRMATAIFNYKLIENNDNILLAVSGGKDSLALLYNFISGKKGLGIKYNFKVVHIKTDFSKEEDLNALTTIFKNWNVDYDIIDVPVLQRLKPGNKMNCYWCSTQRRTELLKYAGKHNFNKIALGHNMDDIIETFFMNMFFKGELSLMKPFMPYKKYKQTIIRPLALVKENDISSFIKEIKISPVSCNCRWNTNSKRKMIKEYLQKIIKDNGDIRGNIFNAIENLENNF